MRKFNNILSVAVILAVMTAISTAALPNTDYFDFSGWSDATIDGGSQVFTGLGANGDIDVTVTINQDFTASGATSYSAGAGLINMGHEASGADSIRFAFSQPIQAVVKVTSVDPEENLKVFGSATEVYHHMGGLSPNVTAIGGGGLQLNGNGFGAGLVSMGEVLSSGLVSSITVTHEALANFKYERIMVGQYVPEPNSAALLGIGAFGLLLSGRKRRRNS